MKLVTNDIFLSVNSRVVILKYYEGVQNFWLNQMVNLTMDLAKQNANETVISGIRPSNNTSIG